jgi:hypothetical protein
MEKEQGSLVVGCWLLVVGGFLLFTPHTPHTPRSPKTVASACSCA